MLFQSSEMGNISTLPIKNLGKRGICIPIDSLLKRYEFRHILEEAKVRWMFLSSKYFDDILEINE
ncbi:MAG: hypothetical protein C0169_01180 [Thermodesulfobacterium geofontis]|uniref:Uncharacterized protein n=1 Tax=Thermodesulfobacterium geofontis TaxID=1295609 RepID=A0A2N7QG96_9BACT|nr:MAG: hypothetical protein C0169_01180 [Thermodesulfobacterium geofontis]